MNLHKFKRKHVSLQYMNTCANDPICPGVYIYIYIQNRLNKTEKQKLKELAVFVL